jgi:hypothetical protein
MYFFSYPCRLMWLLINSSATRNCEMSSHIVLISKRCRSTSGRRENCSSEQCRPIFQTSRFAFHAMLCHETQCNGTQ